MFLEPLMVILQLAGSRHIMCSKPWPEPRAWAGFGFPGPTARAWISSGPRQAEPSQAGPAHHYRRQTRQILNIEISYILREEPHLGLRKECDASRAGEDVFDIKEGLNV